MEIKKEEIVEVSDSVLYTDYDRQQFIVDLDVDEQLIIQVKDKTGEVIKEKIFTAKYVNCHFNLQWQDRSEKQL